jgi:hypothetical protein
MIYPIFVVNCLYNILYFLWLYDDFFIILYNILKNAELRLLSNYNIKYICTIYTRLYTCLMSVSRYSLRDKVTLRFIYTRLKIKPNSVRNKFLSCQIFVLPSTGFELTPLIHCRLDLQLPVQSVHITTKVAISNPVHGAVYTIQQYVIKVWSTWYICGEIWLKCSLFLTRMTWLVGWFMVSNTTFNNISVISCLSFL